VSIAAAVVSTDQQGSSGLDWKAGGMRSAATPPPISMANWPPSSPKWSPASVMRTVRNWPIEHCKRQQCTLLIATLDRLTRNVHYCLARNVHFISGLMESG
jgi:hypothetical protein